MGLKIEQSTLLELRRSIRANWELRQVIKAGLSTIRDKISSTADHERRDDLVMVYQQIEVIVESIENEGNVLKDKENRLLELNQEKN